MALQQPGYQYYDLEQSDDKRPLQTFHQFLQESFIRTDNPVTSKQEKFLPFEQIEVYFSEEDRLIDVLSAVFPDEEPIPVEDSVVQDSYLKTFCILLSIGGARYIRHFVEHDGLSDARLPHTSKPHNFPISPSQPKLWDLFYEKQWLFCAAEMHYKINNSLEPNRILPIVERKVLGQGGSAVVSKIVLHKSFNRLRHNSSSSSSSPDYNDTFVLKTYHKHEASAYYHNEVDAFRRLRPPRGSADPNIIHFYGSFIQNGTYNVILAFADKGTLEEYFKTVLPPTSGRDIEHFWASLCGILKALIHIHEVDCQNTQSGPQILQGWHQDVKPDNILVMSNEIDSPYDWKFKLSDLGLTHFKRSSKEGSDVDAYGTETYGAPECYRADRFLEESTLTVKQNVDIWSFGCILAEAAVWLIHGYKGLQDFRNRRRAAISAIPDMKNGDWFHNGTAVLPIVLETIDGLEKDFRNSDNVTGAVLEKLVKNMLDDPEARFTAKQAHVYARRILHRPSIVESPVVSSSSQGSEGLPTVATVITPTAILGTEKGRLTQNPDTVMHHPVEQPAATTVSPAPIVESQPAQKPQNGNSSNLNVPVPNLPKTERRSSTTSASGSSRSANRSPGPSGQPLTPTVSNSRSMSSRHQSKERSQTELPKLEVDVAERWIQEKKAGRQRTLQGKYLLNRLETRDHVFLIDDAATMKSHEADVKRILGILAYLVKDSDPDGLELYFTCSKRKFKDTDPSKLVTKFMSNVPGGLTDIRTRLSLIIDNYIKGFNRGWLMKKVKPVRSLNIYVLTDGIWQPNTDLTPPIRRLINKLNENGQYQVGIQFISFGNNVDALKRLDDLDDKLGLTMDIIDHERSTGNVWKMLFGATDPWFDEDKPTQAAGASNFAVPSGR